MWLENGAKRTSLYLIGKAGAAILLKSPEREWEHLDLNEFVSRSLELKVP